MVVALRGEAPFVDIVHGLGLRVEAEEIDIVCQTQGEVILSS